MFSNCMLRNSCATPVNVCLYTLVFQNLWRLNDYEMVREYNLPVAFVEILSVTERVNVSK